MDEKKTLEEVAKEFDDMSCAKRLEMIGDMLNDAVEQHDFDLVLATLIPLELTTNRVRMLEEGTKA